MHIDTFLETMQTLIVEIENLKQADSVLINGSSITINNGKDQFKIKLTDEQVSNLKLDFKVSVEKIEDKLDPMQKALKQINSIAEQYIYP